MRSIFEKAHEVLIWLELISDRTFLPPAFLKYFCQRGVPSTFLKQRADFYGFNQDLESRKFLQDMLTCDYWSRARSKSLAYNRPLRHYHDYNRMSVTYWLYANTRAVIQKIAVASQVRILIAEHKIDWSYIESLVDVLYSIVERSHDSHISDFCTAFLETRKLVMACRKLFVLSHLRRQRGQSLLSVLELTVGTKQRLSSDAIYSKLGLASDSSRIVTSLDYSKDHERPSSNLFSAISA